MSSAETIGGQSGSGSRLGGERKPLGDRVTLAREPLEGQMRRTAAEMGEPQREPTAQAGAGLVRTKILHRIDDVTPEAANANALAALAKGADGLAFVFSGGPGAFGRGLPANQDAVATALRDVPLSSIHVRMDPHPASRASIDWLVRQLVTRRIPLDRIDVSFGIDPAAIFAGTGWLKMSIDAMKASMPQSLAHYFAIGLPGVLLEADGRVFHNAGASEAQELGIMIASAISYLRMFEEARQPALYAAAHIGFAVALDQNRAGSAIKIAALRKLWARVLESYSVPPMAAVIHAESSWRMMSAANTDANAARAFASAIAAIDAGADTLTLLSPDLAATREGSFATDALMSQLYVLAREAGRAAPVDRGDADVSRLAEAAWQEVRVIENEGGILRSILEGRVQARVMTARAERIARVAREQQPFIGQSVAAAEPAFRDPRAPDAAPAGNVTCIQLPPIRVDQMLAEAQDAERA